MPTYVQHSYVSAHALNYAGGQVTAAPAIPAADRLYVVGIPGCNGPHNLILQSGHNI
jgi:hypothetical protein